ncbi:unnamed protein product [Protopolystoma xenopodis]|uniref:Uncharacterized protein n=1 Tax=Protopolystoma xenopodis TaxID=117903 RepID=A0A3S5FCC6_9PLAT|nr:unnamed protein product [Protopolystoma xenopodis]
MFISLLLPGAACRPLITQFSVCSLFPSLSSPPSRRNLFGVYQLTRLANDAAEQAARDRLAHEQALAKQRTVLMGESNRIRGEAETAAAEASRRHAEAVRALKAAAALEAHRRRKETSSASAAAASNATAATYTSTLKAAAGEMNIPSSTPSEGQAQAVTTECLVSCLRQAQEDRANSLAKLAEVELKARQLEQALDTANVDIFLFLCCFRELICL